MKVKMFNKSNGSRLVTVVVVTCVGNCKCCYAEPHLLVFLFFFWCIKPFQWFMSLQSSHSKQFLFYPKLLI
jgi:hypothetical protein